VEEKNPVDFRETKIIQKKIVELFSAHLFFDFQKNIHKKNNSTRINFFFQIFSTYLMKKPQKIEIPKNYAFFC